MDVARLKSVMVLHGDNGGKLAKALGISPQRLSAKINEHKGAEFTQGEITKIKNRYNLTPEELEQIFFAE